MLSLNLGFACSAAFLYSFAISRLLVKGSGTSCTFAIFKFRAFMYFSNVPPAEPLPTISFLSNKKLYLRDQKF